MTEVDPGRTTRRAAIAFGVLLLATFGAFFAASELKSRPPELRDLTRLKYFSPNGDGRRDRQPITFRLAVSDDAAVDVIDEDGARVRRIEDGVPIRRGGVVRTSWDGRLDDGTRAPDGAYRLRIILQGEGRSVLAPRRFILDTRPPNPQVTVYRTSSVVAPGTEVAFKVAGTGRYTVPEFTVYRTDVAPLRKVRTFKGTAGKRNFRWDGLDDAGKPVPPGTYLIGVGARDQARNLGLGPPMPPQAGQVDGLPGVTVRRLAVQPPVRPVRAGELVSFRVDARGARYRWSLRRLGTGRAVAESRQPKRSSTLVVRAPTGPSGAYLLEVASRGAKTSVPLAIQAKRRRKLLVVLPVITWLGQDPVDGDGDGLPDTFANNRPVRFPRLYGYPGGLPAGLADRVAPLLIWLDRNDIEYDITTDVALALDDAPLDKAAHPGVLFAGSPEYVSRPVSRGLRRFVAGGGRVATFGPRSLRAGVTVGDAVLSRPTPPGRADALGGRFQDARDPGTEPLTVLQEDETLGLFEGFSGELSGFSRLEELSAAGRGEVVSSIAEPLSEAETQKAEADNVSPRELRPVVSAVKAGEGYVFRIGAVGWEGRLDDGDPAVGQITFNLVDLLLGRKPRARSAQG